MQVIPVFLVIHLLIIDFFVDNIVVIRAIVRRSRRMDGCGRSCVPPQTESVDVVEDTQAVAVEGNGVREGGKAPVKKRSLPNTYMYILVYACQSLFVYIGNELDIHIMSLWSREAAGRRHGLHDLSDFLDKQTNKPATDPSNRDWA